MLKILMTSMLICVWLIDNFTSAKHTSFGKRYHRGSGDLTKWNSHEKTHTTDESNGFLDIEVPMSDWSLTAHVRKAKKAYDGNCPKERGSNMLKGWEERTIKDELEVLPPRPGR